MPSIGQLHLLSSDFHLHHRSSSISPSVHSSGSLRPRSDSQVAVDAMLPVKNRKYQFCVVIIYYAVFLQILLGYKEKEAGVENAINLWGEQKTNF